MEAGGDASFIGIGSKWARLAAVTLALAGNGVGD